MAKSRLTLEETKDLFLYSTEIENLFINEFLQGLSAKYGEEKAAKSAQASPSIFPVNS